MSGVLGQLREILDSLGPHGNQDPPYAESVTLGIKRARRLLDLHSLDQTGPPPDNTLRNMAAQEAFRNARADRERRIAKAEINDDEAFVRNLRELGGIYAQTALFISSVARFAGELQHSLIHPDVRQKWADAEGNSYVKQHIIQEHTTDWESIVDPGLAGNAYMVCSNIATAYPQRLQDLSPAMIVEAGDHKLIHYFSATVAARWRTNAVFGAGVYKTGNQQDAVAQALREAIRLFAHYKVNDGQLQHAPLRTPPTTLQEHIAWHS